MRTFIPFTSHDEIRAIGLGLVDRTLPKPAWTHAAHFAAALWLLACRPELEVSRAMPGIIRAYNQATGVANTDTSGYHERITQASIRAARCFLAAGPPGPLFIICNALLASPLGSLTGCWRIGTRIRPSGASTLVLCRLAAVGLRQLFARHL